MYSIRNRKTNSTLTDNGQVHIFHNKTAAEQALSGIFKQLEETGQEHLKNLFEIVEIRKTEDYIQ